MSIFSKKKICITHNGAFHADDIFATAVLYILNNGNIKIIRTRNPRVIERGDYVYDVGGEYSTEKNIFDHHQKGGAGFRDDGVPYSAFGLVWKRFGNDLCGNEEVAFHIEKKIVEPLDAIDNGFDIYKPLYDGIHPYTIVSYLMAEAPTWKEENKNMNKIFKKLVLKAVSILRREIVIGKHDVLGKKIIIESYNKSIDKKIIVLDQNFPRYLYQNTLSMFEEPFFLIFQSGHSSVWKIEAIRKNNQTLESRKYFPVSWRGIFDIEKLREVSGINDILFCHQSGFLSETETKDGAISLAKKALLS